MIVRLGLPRWHSGKESSCQCRRCRRRGFGVWSGRSTGEGNGNLLHYSRLGNPVDRGACGPQSIGSQRVRHAYTLLSSVKLHELRQRSALVTDKVELPTLPNSPLFLPKGSATYLRRSWPVMTFVSRDTAQAVRRGSLRAHVLSQFVFIFLGWSLVEEE